MNWCRTDGANVAVAAIAVLQVKHEDAAAKISRSVKRRFDLVHGDEVDAAGIEASIARLRIRVPFEMAVGLEFGLARRPHMVHDEECADAGEDRPQQKMRAGEI